MSAVDEFRQLLEAGDFKALRAAWHRVAPNMPQPKNDEQAEIVMHMARTASETINMGYRLYSHTWLIERALPSQLPQKLHPVISEAVGISVNFKSRLLAPAAAEVQGAMEYAVLDCYANGDRDVATVRDRMTAARERTLKVLFG